MTTILVIDDDEQIRHYLRNVLEEVGYSVHLACNGVEGIRAYQEEPADLVFCDLFMDQKEGLETILQLLHDFPQARIIAMSGSSTLVPGDYLYHAGMFGAVATLSKPLEREFLLQTVGEVLNDRGWEWLATPGNRTRDRPPARWSRWPDAPPSWRCPAPDFSDWSWCSWVVHQSLAQS